MNWDTPYRLRRLTWNEKVIWTGEDQNPKAKIIHPISPILFIALLVNLLVYLYSFSLLPWMLILSFFVVYPIYLSMQKSHFKDNYYGITEKRILHVKSKKVLSIPFSTIISLYFENENELHEIKNQIDFDKVVQIIRHNGGTFKLGSSKKELKPPKSKISDRNDVIDLAEIIKNRKTHQGEPEEGDIPKLTYSTTFQAQQLLNINYMRKAVTLPLTWTLMLGNIIDDAIVNK